MDKAARIRWGILMTALAATISGIILPGPEDADGAVQLVRQPIASSIRPSAAMPVASSDAEPDESETDVDPFAPRGWQAPPPSAPTSAPAAQLTVAPVDLTPPGPPPLPFRFVGSFADGSEQLVYLARGEQALVAHTGDILDSNYKVVAISPALIEFEHIPTSTRQTLAIPVRDN